MKNKLSNIIGASISLSLLLIIIFFGIFPVMKENEEYNCLPKETWIEVNSSFELNGKKCKSYSIFNGVKDKKWDNYNIISGRFVQCEGDAFTSPIEVKSKQGWK